MRLPIVKEGFPFIGLGILITFLVGYFVHPIVAVLPGVLTAFFTYFFRNPQRDIPKEKNILVSPADGTVMEISDVENDDFLKSSGRKVVIFLSVFNVHVNRSPMAGEIKCQQYSCGRFDPAYKKGVGFENERHMIGIEDGNMRITVTQIAGILARRIVSWVTLNDGLTKGELYGMIRFGSCTEVVVPKNVKLLVKKGDKVVGGETIIGRILDK